MIDGGYVTTIVQEGVVGRQTVAHHPMMSPLGLRKDNIPMLTLSKRSTRLLPLHKEALLAMISWSSITHADLEMRLHFMPSCSLRPSASHVIRKPICPHHCTNPHAFHAIALCASALINTPLCTCVHPIVSAGWSCSSLLCSCRYKYACRDQPL